MHYITSYFTCKICQILGCAKKTTCLFMIIIFVQENITWETIPYKVSTY